MVDMRTRLRLEDAIREVRPRGWKVSLRVVDRSEVVLTIAQAPVDPIAFLLAYALPQGQEAPAVTDLRVAHARRYCLPVRIPVESEVLDAVKRLTPEQAEAGVVLSRLDAALRQPGLDALGRQVGPGAGYLVHLQIGARDKPFQVASVARYRPVTAALADLLVRPPVVAAAGEAAGRAPSQERAALSPGRVPF